MERSGSSSSSSSGSNGCKERCKPNGDQTTPWKYFLDDWDYINAKFLEFQELSLAIKFEKCSSYRSSSSTIDSVGRPKEDPVLNSLNTSPTEPQFEKSSSYRSNSSFTIDSVGRPAERPVMSGLKKSSIEPKFEKCSSHRSSSSSAIESVGRPKEGLNTSPTEPQQMQAAGPKTPKAKGVGKPKGSQKARGGAS